jgi:glycosyltransferase involved in cell wall biosynthesis
MMNATPSVPRVAVLLSTYNGEQYLAAQLDSLASQELVSVELFVRDDGSTDNSIDIIRRYAERWPTLANLGSSPNIRPAASFMELIRSTPTDFDYYAFCDQDDVWCPRKLSYAVETLTELKADTPGLYCSLATCVDNDLNAFGSTSFRGKGDFEHLMFASIVLGNTVVMNRAAMDLVRSRTPGTAVIMHDWWCALVVSAFGKVVADPRMTLLYRQHHGNTVGTAPGRIAGLLVQLKVFLRNPRAFYPIHAQVAEFLRLYGDQLGPAERKTAEALVRSRRSVGARIAYAAFARIPRWDFLGSVGTRILIGADLY